ncbi:MAG: penicillin-binding protein 1A [Halothermotrichaceae bacterium]
MARKKQIIISVIILFIAIFFGISIGAITWIVTDTPDISDYKGASEATKVYSADGQLLTKLYRQNRINVPLDRIPQNLQNAVVAVEDTNFYTHRGVDFWGIGRAVVTNLLNRAGRPQGASTITQQLAGNALLDRQNVSYYRKIQEAYLALQFERNYTKPQIIEMYLNEIFFGHSSWGVEAASQQYFDKHVWELNLSESALIAGLPKGPNHYSPIKDYDKSIHRRNVVLNRMLELGYITEKEHKKAKNTEIVIKSAEPDKEETAPYFVRHIRDQLLDKFGPQMVYSGGLKVYTTLDPSMQEKAENAVQKAIDQKIIPTVERKNTDDKLQPQMSVVTIDPKTGYIRAMIGGRGNDQFNRAVQATRQPGSAFKPFVYTTAVKNGWSTANIINDMPLLAKADKGEPKKLWPTNSGDKYRGLVTLRSALKHSINVASVKLIQQVGVIETIKTAENMGITTLQSVDKNEDHLSLALGGLNKGVTPIEMTSAYGIFANQGILVEPVAITKVLDQRDNLLFEAHPEKKIVLKEDVSYLITSMLRSVIKGGGTGWRANIPNRDVAGKTGTTNEFTDAWFVGYTPDLVTGVWIGEDKRKTMEYNQKDENGNYLFPEGNQGRTISSSEAARLWGDYMNKVVNDMPVTKFKVPSNITTEEIDPITGYLPNEHTPSTVTEVFRKNNVPTKTDDLHQPVVTAEIDKESGLLATSSCPEENVIEYNYLSESGYRVGPATISFSNKNDRPENNKNEDESKEIHGTYYVDQGEPVQVIDKKTGVPETENGEVIYQEMPTQKCDLHPEESDELIDDIWNFFNGL